MDEEKNNDSKKSWSRVFRKKWFFPALYLVCAVLLLTVVVWYKNLLTDLPNAEGDINKSDLADMYSPEEYEPNAEPVFEEPETVRMPIENPDSATIATTFFDYSADMDAQEKALVRFNDTFYQSTGINLVAEDGETFNVLASLSGEVTSIKDDPFLGNVVEMTHGDDVKTYYASLDDVDVNVGDEIEQGDIVGTAGENLFGKDNGIHVHFEIKKSGVNVDPESVFHKKVDVLKDMVSDDGENKDESDLDEEERSDIEQGDDTKEDGQKSDDKDSGEDSNEDNTENSTD